MKNFRSIFYTAPSRTIMLIILFVLAYFVGECQLDYFRLYNKDRESFANATIQMDSFDYETSYYFRNIVKDTIKSVIVLSTNYSEIFEKEMDADTLLSYYGNVGDTTFPEIYETLSSIKGFRFAFVNYDTNKIFSNIPELNNKPNSTNVRRHFGMLGKTLLVARSCKSPYFETDTFMRYADYIRELAEKYDVNFDIYIYFGDDETFEQDAQQFKKLHFAMRKEIEKINNTVLVLISLIIFVSICIVTITGRTEPGGKIYLKQINKLPNDLILFFYGIVLMCIVSLYRTSFYMIVSRKAEHDEFWFTRSEEFYTNRVHFCIVFFICLIVNLICIMKRSYKTGSLITNTYIYHFVKNIKIRFGKMKPDEKE